MQTKQNKVHIILCLIAIASTLLTHTAQTKSCPVTTNLPYSHAQTNGVWYVSEDCTKRPIKNPDVFFSHFDSWNTVNTVSRNVIETIPNNVLGFLPWGEKRTFKNGSLIKTVDDPRVFLKINNSIYPVQDEQAFYTLGYSFSFVEDVVADVIAQFTVGDTVSDITSAPANFLFKYPNDPKIYLLEKREGVLAKRHINSFEDVKRDYRIDRISTINVNITVENSTHGALPAGSDLTSVGDVSSITYVDKTVESEREQPPNSNDAASTEFNNIEQTNDNNSTEANTDPIEASDPSEQTSTDRSFSNSSFSIASTRSASGAYGDGALDATISAVGYSSVNPTISGTAPLVVHVHGLNSGLGTGNPTTALYEWNFGDATGDHNEIIGYGGAHVYDTPGSYTVRLTVTNDQGQSSLQTITVNVLSEPRSTIYISPAGNDSNNGSGPSSAIQTIPRLNELLQSDTTILFERGGTYTVTPGNGLTISEMDNIVISSYGIGSMPNIIGPSQQGSATGIGSMIDIHDSVHNVIVENISFSTPVDISGVDPAVMTAISVTDSGYGDADGVTRIAVRNNRFHNVYSAIESFESGNGDVQGIFAYDNIADTVGKYFWYAGGSDYTAIRNTLTSSIDGHGIRFYADRMFVYENDMRANDVSTSISAAASSYSYIRGNTARHGMRVGYLAVDGYTVARHVVVEGNRVVRDNNPSHAFVPSLWLYPNSENIAVRNNIFTDESVSIRLDSPETLQDIYILNNTVYQNDDAGGFIEMFGTQSNHDNIVIANNLFVQPAFLGGRYNGGSDPFIINFETTALEGITIAGNAWQDSSNGTSHRQGLGGTQNSDWQSYAQTTNEIFLSFDSSSLDEAYRLQSYLQSQTAPITVPGVHIDYNLDLRTSVGIGAVQ